jgi:deoxyadenosine/deoxycytidine kinase
MLIVIEGPDGSGKSTLLSALRKNSLKQYCLCVSASRASDASQHFRFLRMLAAVKGQIFGHIVCDRFHSISEAVYGSVLRGGTLTEPFGCIDWDWQKDLSLVDLIVYCRPSIEQMQANLEKNAQMEGVKERINTLVVRYDRLMDDLRAFKPLLEYNYRVDLMPSLIHSIFGGTHVY